MQEVISSSEPPPDVCQEEAHKAKGKVIFVGGVQGGGQTMWEGTGGEGEAGGGRCKVENDRKGAVG